MTLPIQQIDAIISTRPELQETTADQWELAYALASCFQQPDPTAEQCTNFIDDAIACIDDVGPGPYTVTKLGDTSGNFSAVVLINNWLCAAEEGEGFIELTTMTNLGDWLFIRTPKAAIAAAASMVTVATLAAAFTEWERRYREEPERFETDAARLAMGAESYGEACAPYLLEILAEQAGRPLQHRPSVTHEGFHATAGWYFARQQNGAVKISAAVDRSTETITLAPAEWASVMAAVSAQGETSESYQAGLALHTGETDR